MSRLRFDIWAQEREKAEVLPNGCRVLRHTDSLGRPCASFWMPKASKPAWSIYFGDEVRREAKINASLTAFEAWKRGKVEARAARTCGDASLANPGAIFSYTWGYDQTNVEYFQVVARSKRTVKLRPIASESLTDSQGFMCDRVRPRKDAFADDCVTCGLIESALAHTEGIGPITGRADIVPHVFTPKPPFVKRLYFSEGVPYLSFEFGTGSLVKVLTFGNAEPLVAGSQYRSWYA